MGTNMLVILSTLLAMFLFLKGELTSASRMEATVCPKSQVQWLNIEGENCYFLQRTKISSWEYALQNCEELGGSLASFHSKDEIDKLRQLFSSKGHEDSPYIGLHRPSDGILRWSDGTAVDFLNWSSGQSKSGIYNCTTMGYYTGNWYSVFCNTSASYLCSTPKRIPCDRNLCKNGGYCPKDGINELFPCRCKHGFQGMTCGEKIKCDSRPCRNGGACKHEGVDGAFNCTCKHGYKGVRCEQKISCNGSLCKNGGTCYNDKISGIFECNCAQGFKGLNCEESENGKTLLIVFVCLGVVLALVFFITLYFAVRRYRRQKAPDPKQLQTAYKKKDTESLESCHMNILDEDEDCYIT